MAVKLSASAQESRHSKGGRTEYCSNEPSYSSGLSFIGLDEDASSNEAKAAGCCGPVDGTVAVDEEEVEGPPAVGEARGEASRSVPHVAGVFFGPEGLRVRVDEDFIVGGGTEREEGAAAAEGCCWVARRIRSGKREIQ